jgi:hypothetical protein
MAAQFWAPTASVDVVVRDGVVNLHGVLMDERERNALHPLVENIDGSPEGARSYGLDRTWCRNVTADA